MAENKTKPTKQSVAEFLDTCPEPRRQDARLLATLMQEVTGCDATMWGASIIGFDSYHYVYESGREGDIMVLGFAPRKAANVLYGATGFPGADALLDKLGDHTTGKGCLYLKSLAEIDLTILKTILIRAVANKRASGGL